MSDPNPNPAFDDDLEGFVAARGALDAGVLPAEADGGGAAPAPAAAGDFLPQIEPDNHDVRVADPEAVAPVRLSICAAAPDPRPILPETKAAAAAAPAEDLDVGRLLRDRPDVFQAFFTEYYGPNNDRHSSAWLDRVGGETVQDYARYWYDHYGRAEGYSQAEGGTVADAPPAEPATPEPGYRNEDPSLDPWNHPALYGDSWRDWWQPSGGSPPPPDPFG